MRCVVFAGLVLILLSGCTAGYNEATPVDCGAHHARQGTRDADTVAFCK